MSFRSRMNTKILSLTVKWPFRWYFIFKNKDKVPSLFKIVCDLFKTGIPIININDEKTSINAKERHETIENSQKRSGTIRNSERLETVSNT
jgi:hypothetical protein